MTKDAAKDSFPASYGRWLIEQARSIGLDKKEIGKLTGYDDPKAVTMWRLKTEDPERSVKAANRVRSVLLDRGLTIPTVPVGQEHWSPSDAVGSGPRLDPSDERVRANLVAARAKIGIDDFAAAHAIGISIDELRDFERGNVIPNNAMLTKIGAVYGCKPGAFLDDALPELKPNLPGLYFGGPDSKHLTDEERATIEAIRASVAKRHAPPAKPSGKKAKR